MNSIDTFIPTLIPLLESEEGVTASSMTAPDTAALEALRALMGGFAQPPAACGVQCSSPDSTTFQRPSAALPSVLERLLQSDGLPPALVPLLTNLRDSLQKGETAQSGPGLVAEIKTLLREIVPAHSGFSRAEGAEGPVIQPLNLGTPGGSRPSIEVVQTPDGPLQNGGVVEKGATPVSDSPAAVSGNSAAAGAATLPADLPTLALVVLRMLGDTPQTSPGSVSVPSFESLLDEDFAPSPPDHPDRPADAPNLGSAILQSLGHQSAPAVAQTGASAGAAERVAEVSNLITQMADRVLVTDPLHGQTQEVRIKIADNVMEGTEVRVWREDGGALRVEFDTTSAYWSRILNDASPLLSQRLNERLPPGTEAQVTVAVQQQGQQPEDGRSRNRQNPWELARQAQES